MNTMSRIASVRMIWLLGFLLAWLIAISPARAQTVSDEVLTSELTSDDQILDPDAGSHDDDFAYSEGDYDSDSPPVYGDLSVDGDVPNDAGGLAIEAEACRVDAVADGGVADGGVADGGVADGGIGCGPLEYQTILEKWWFPMKVTAGVTEHSATRVIRRTRQGGAIVNAELTDHGNHGRGPAALGGTRYFRVGTVWTNNAGRGFTTYDWVRNKKCAGAYGFNRPDHICHSDTRMQERIFLRQGFGMGEAALPPDKCIAGLWTGVRP